MRHDGRAADELRPVTLERPFLQSTQGSVLYRSGGTVVLCTASVQEGVPGWREGSGKGWLTAEYNMLPSSTSPRKPRERGGRVDGRTAEIQRLIGRSLRAVADLEALGERTVAIDCDVLQADGGTRTASITGAFIALVDALRGIPGISPGEAFPLRDSVAAVSVGMLAEAAILDLDYQEDVAVRVDLNLVMTGSDRFIELQGTGEEATFSRDELQDLLWLGEEGIRQLTAIQREVLGDAWPFT